MRDRLMYLIEFCGKFYDITYRKAISMLRNRALMMGVEMPEKIVAIATAHIVTLWVQIYKGHSGTLILLQSGVWQGDMGCSSKIRYFSPMRSKRASSMRFLV